MIEKLGIRDDVYNLMLKSERELYDVYANLDDICTYNSMRVLKAFQDNKVSDVHFNSSTGYGYGDIGRDVIESIFAQVLGAEDALVRSQLISGTHALTVGLFSFLRHNDTLLSISGKPYDTLDEVIGIRENSSSLGSYGIHYEEIDLINSDFDYEKIKKRLLIKDVRVIYIQRSRGYSLRESISLSKIKKIVSLIKELGSKAIIMVDNCYSEFVSKESIFDTGVSVAVGSLIKNLGGGIASNGGYIAGNRDLIHLAAERLNVPGQGKEVGPSMGMNKSLLQGLYMAPSVVRDSLKTAILSSKMLQELGYDVKPLYNEDREDIVQSIVFNDKNKLIKYCRGIQSGSAISADLLLVPSLMPGYDEEIIMASGSFTQGSSIELSCDGPLKEPYVAYMQGSLTYDYGKLGVMKAISCLLGSLSNSVGRQ